jgi:two-component system cell cycle sensor histidine kinase/response regulator CckA
LSEVAAKSDSIELNHDRNRTEEALLASERQFASAFENAPIGMALVAPDGRWLKVNHSICKMVGYTVPELLALTFQDITFPDDMEKDLHNVHRMLAGEIENYQMEKRYRHKDGHIVPVLLSVSLVKDKTGQPVHFISQIQDITERKQAETALKFSEEKFSKAFRLSPDAMSISDLETGCYLEVNEAYEKMFGFTKAMVIGRSPLELNLLPDPEIYEQMQKVLRQQGYLHNFEIRVNTFGGDILTVLHSLEIIDLGERKCVLRVSHDVTRQRELEEQFRQSQKMEAIGQLAGGVAHDFNNILAVIQMQAELLKGSGDLSATQTEFTDGICAATQRATSLIRQLLVFSRKESLRQQDLDLNEAVSHITKMLERTLGAAIRIQFKFSLQPLFIHADAGMIDQILMNLAVNSRDAMPQGGQLAIEVSGVELDETTAAQMRHARSGSFVCLAVSDTGCGIPAGNLPRIFEPFFTTKDVGKGTGLGLATVFGIVQQHHGWITVHSETGRGTTFRIYLPRLAKIPEPETGLPAALTFRGGDETILFVEDDPFLRVSLGKAIKQLGYRVLAAADGAEALEIWQKKRGEIDLMLTDMVMPGGITGKELCARLLKDDPELKVIYASGYSVETAGKDFLPGENVRFLAKPFVTAKLAQTIRAALDA